MDLIEWLCLPHIVLGGLYVVLRLFVDKSLTFGEILLFAWVALATYFFIDYRKTKKQKKQREQKRKVESGRQRENITAELHRKLREGTLPFPAERFYRLCKENHIETLDNEFAYTKARQQAEKCLQDVIFMELLPSLKKEYEVDSRLISEGDSAENIRCMLTFHGAPDERLNWQFEDGEGDQYFCRERMEQFLREGRDIARGADYRKLEAQKRPKAASPNATEATFLRRVSELSGLTGNRKRMKMLDDLVQDYRKQIQAMKDGEEAMKQLGMLYMQQQKKESDWGFAAGVADGLAGPVAGVMAASQVEERNRDIRKHNAAMRDTSRNILSGIPGMMSDRVAAERQLAEVARQRWEAEEKISLSNPNADEIWGNLQTGKPEIRKAESGVLHISLPVHLKAPFALDIPYQVTTVVDGILSGEVWFREQLVGTVMLPLPLYGIPTDMTAEVTLDGMLDSSVELSGEYTLRMAEQHSLWVMEA